MNAPVRQAVGFMNYPGDCTASIRARIKSGEPMGPNYMGEWMWPISAAFEADKNRTRVGFSLMAPAAVTR